MEDKLSETVWKPVPEKGFGPHAGPIQMRHEDGQIEYGVDLKDIHANGLGGTHGGLLATLADTALGMTTQAALGPDQSSVTVQLNLQFISAPQPGEFIRAKARIVRQTRHLFFMEGEVFGERGLFLTATGIWKISSKRSNSNERA